ncbi:MAG TPA: lasso peptide biosynthesis B2 protein [Actinomycetota bacterium]|nr:lasso peptide biosynthesis B2 protein [Actinomycetota bacterium]
MKHLPDLAEVRAALWTLRAAQRARHDLERSGLNSVHLPPPPDVSPQAARGMNGVFRRTNYTCLVRALVRQAWAESFGEHRDVVIGVTAPQSGFKAHAWLENEAPCHEERYHELLRYRA